MVKGNQGKRRRAKQGILGYATDTTFIHSIAILLPRAKGEERVVRKWIRPRGRSTKVESSEAEEMCDLARRFQGEVKTLPLVM